MSELIVAEASLLLLLEALMCVYSWIVHNNERLRTRTAVQVEFKAKTAIEMNFKRKIKYE